MYRTLQYSTIYGLIQTLLKHCGEKRSGCSKSYTDISVDVANAKQRCPKTRHLRARCFSFRCVGITCLSLVRPVLPRGLLRE